MGFADYSAYGRAMAVGVARHEGDLGAWNVALNTVFCLGILRDVVEAPAARHPPAGRTGGALDMALWKGALAVGLVLAVTFPLGGLAILAALLLDVLLLSRAPAVKQLIS